MLQRQKTIPTRTSQSRSLPNRANHAQIPFTLPEKQNNGAFAGLFQNGRDFCAFLQLSTNLRRLALSMQRKIWHKQSVFV